MVDPLSAGGKTTTTLALDVVAANGSIARREFAISRLLIAGWTGRDQDAVQAHVRELEEVGVKPPSSIPVFYRAGVEKLTTRSCVQVIGGDSSGEVETVLLADGDDLFVALGSDHTDRKVEAYSIAVSKQMCPKPVSPMAWLYADVAGHWDSLVLRSWATIDGRRQLYQEGTLAALLTPAALFNRLGAQPSLPAGTAMFGGTFSAIGGIRSAEKFDLLLEDPVLGRSLSHSYAIEVLPVVS